MKVCREGKGSRASAVLTHARSPHPKSKCPLLKERAAERVRYVRAAPGLINRAPPPSCSYPIVFEAVLEGALLTPAEFTAATAKYHVPDVRFSTRYVLSEAFVTEID